MTSTDIEADAPSEGELVPARFRSRAQTNGRKPRREHRSEILANPAMLVRTTSHSLNLSFTGHSPVIHRSFTGHSPVIHRSFTGDSYSQTVRWSLNFFHWLRMLGGATQHAIFT
ncbi:MAG: hypothetical protein DWH97_12985 [Planctomycetota bacterium]|nr:MAG: hypothetical protein DWH97_12985 [Planctomycetota bacterium]